MMELHTSRKSHSATISHVFDETGLDEVNEFTMQEGYENSQEQYLNYKENVIDSGYVITKNQGVPNVLQWDPWQKISHNKKNIKSKKQRLQKTLASAALISKCENLNFSSSVMKAVRKKAKEDIAIHDEIYNYDMLSIPENYLSKEYRKSKKNVRFHNDVTVVIFNEDKLLNTVKEPLKKEQDQQERNKELRKAFGTEGIKMIRVPRSKRDKNTLRLWTRRK